MYDRVPTKLLAIESISCPETPKSQILISPAEFTRMLLGLTSLGKTVVQVLERGAKSLKLLKWTVFKFQWRTCELSDAFLAGSSTPLALRKWFSSGTSPLFFPPSWSPATWYENSWRLETLTKSRLPPSMYSMQMLISPSLWKAP